MECLLLAMGFRKEKKWPYTEKLKILSNKKKYDQTLTQYLHKILNSVEPNWLNWPN